MGVLSKTVIAITGTLTHEPSVIKKWVEANGGKWTARVVPNVTTHLLAAKDAWKRVTDPVMQAAELNIFIVSYDWLEDSLQGKRRLAEKKYTWEHIKADHKRRRQIKKLGTAADGKKFLDGCKKIKELTGSGTSKKLPLLRKLKPSKSHFFAPTINTPFESALDNLKRRRAEREATDTKAKAERAARQAVLKTSGTTQDAPIEIEDESTTPNSLPTPPGFLSPSSSQTTTATTPSPDSTPTVVPQAKKPVLKDLYHFYLDVTGFEYKITLARSNFASNNITRYQISILESHTTPHTYCTFIQYSPPQARPAEAPTDTSTISNLRNPLLAFLKQASDETEQKTPTRPTANQQPEAIRAAQPTQTAKEAAAQEAACLHALAKPPTPLPSTPYKRLIVPMGSPFDTAWRAFRHIFRDLTLLAWEERFDPNKRIQKSRAQILNIEPYSYAKPTPGLPVGLMPQESGLCSTSANGDVVIMGDAESGYVRNEWDLPGLNEALGRQGVVGSAIWRDGEDVRRREDDRQRKVEEREEAERRRRGEGKKKRVDYRAPLFNCATGRPGARMGEGVQGKGSETSVKPGARWGYEV